METNEIHNTCLISKISWYFNSPPKTNNSKENLKVALCYSHLRMCLIYTPTLDFQIYSFQRDG